MHVRPRCDRMSLLTRVMGVLVLLGLTVAAPDVADAQEGAPHLVIEYQVSPEQVSSLSDELTVAITVSGRGGRVGDLPLEVRDRLPRRPLEVVLVVDRSGSMERDDYRPTRLEAAKRAAEVFLQQIQPGDSAALVSFEAYVTLDVPLTEDRELTLEALWHLRPDGGTAIGEGIHRAIQVLQEGAKESVKAIVLLSDGASNEGRDPVVAANEARDAGIPVFTVGIGVPGDDFDEFTLRSIAETTGGEYLYAPDASELSRVYERMGGKVINVAGVNASLDIEVTGLLDLDEYTTDGLDEASRNTRLVYRYDQIPVGEAKTIYLRGRPTALLPGERAPVIETVRLAYQSLGSERERVVTAGPVEVEFDDSLLEGDGVRIDRISFDRTETQYPDSNVYLLNDDVRPEIELNRRARGEIDSLAAILGYGSFVGLTRRLGTEVTGDVIRHKLDGPDYVGRYTLMGTLRNEDGLHYDDHRTDFFVVFEPPRNFQVFAEATTVYGDLNFRKGKWTKKTTLHPRHPRILESAAHLLETSEPRGFLFNDPTHAARGMALNLQPDLVAYSLERFLPKDNDHRSDLDILNAGLGDCTDMAALYASMARSLNIPVRLVAFYYDDAGSKVGHAFVEVYLDGEWVHADPTWWSFDETDVYLNSGRTQFDGSVETSPGVIEYDRRTTLKYSVGLLIPGGGATLLHNLDEGNEFSRDLVFQNSAAVKSTLWVFPTGEPKAEDVGIRVMEDGGLDIGRLRLDGDDVLDPGERDVADLEIEVPDEIAESIPPGGERQFEILLEFEYGDSEGGTITKTYPFVVILRDSAS